jgi:hypothetical protein
MKTRIIIALIALLIWPASALKSQQQPEQLNLPGDNLNLYAVMKIFQESETLELFEKTLNEQDARINNLDLNGDNFIDYIKVIDHVEKNVHYIVLQVSVSPTENQDVAVFVVKQDPDGKVIIQLIGDEELYGKYYIVEPYYDTDNGSTPNPGYYGNYGKPETVVVHHTTEYEVASWPLIRFMFLPGYIAWHSPWYWDYYPTYWHPWTPWFWHEYYGYHWYWHHHYYAYYHPGHHNRFDNWNDHYYGPRRSTSSTVSNRLSRGEFSTTYSKPESIRDGSAYFKKQHPEMVKSDMKDPEVKDIRSGGKVDKSDKNNANQKENIKPGKENSGKNWAKPGKSDVKPDKDSKDKVKNFPGNSEKGKSDKNTGGNKSEKSSSVKKTDSKSSGSGEKKESGRATKSEPSKSNTKDSKSNDKGGRK